MSPALLRLALAAAATAAGVLVFHYLRAYPWRTTLYASFAVGALVYVAVGTFIRLSQLFRSERYRIDRE